ncbi:MAG: NAD(P)H-binding protein [Oenococcus sp.]|uniref:NAD(P)H-binding protein n=1 Tax=Oenococcus TaxID=46254 RepID=UPI0021E85BD4|nr:NAD(P)H-binding protein [Oenococcus kitaharae]MCV3296975.1 NAD(P)H-binding protein [Oenococcus kitaharae]
MNMLILAANGAIARLVEEKILSDAKYKDVQLTLFLRNKSRLSDLADNARVKLVEGDLLNASDVNAAAAGQDLVFIAFGATSNLQMTQNVVDAMQANQVKRVVEINDLGIYDEVPGKFGAWNKQIIGAGIQVGFQADALLEKSGLDYTTLRLPWLNNRDEVKYVLTEKDETFPGTSGSRKSIADVVLRIVADPSFGSKASLGIADPATAGLDKPVY